MILCIIAAIAAYL